MPATPGCVFLSYSHEDAELAAQVKNVIEQHGLDVWFDVERISPGDRVSDRIEQGISESDYFVILISAAAASSRWVRQELSLAFELAATKKSTIVPLIAKAAPIPIELRGLLFIDFRQSVQKGLTRLGEFFAAQSAPISSLETRVIVRRSGDEREGNRRACETTLRSLELGDLRFELSRRLTLDDLEVMWFDLFHSRMRDEAPAANVAMGWVQVLDRARREDLLYRLVDIICRNHPFLGRVLRT